MDEHMGRRTVGGLLFTKGGSILLFREDGARRKASSCCSRHGCSSRHSGGDKAKAKETNSAAVPNEPTPAATPRGAQIFRRTNRKPAPQDGSANPDSVSSSRDGAGAGSSSCGEAAGGRPRDSPGRDLLSRLKDRVNASKKRSLNRENSSASSANGLIGPSSPSSSSSSSLLVSRPSHRAASRIRKADAGASNAADGGGVHGGSRAGAAARVRERSEEDDDELMLVEQATRDLQPAADGFLSGFMTRYRSGLQGRLSSLDDGMEDSNGYWRFDTGITEELENYFIFNDRHRGMRMDIDGMSYEELLALGERIGTVSTGLSDDALSKCLTRSIYSHSAGASGPPEDCCRKCSICQEEYASGEELGMMACKHYYHLPCIQHWLRQKNWCPICKSVALNAN